MTTTVLPQKEQLQGIENLLKSPENSEYLKPIRDTQEEYTRKFNEMRTNARGQIGGALLDIGHGFVEAERGHLAAGASFVADFGEGAIMGALTQGLSEFFPFSEEAVDTAMAWMVKKAKIPVKPIDWALGLGLSVVPGFGDLVSPGLLAGLRYSHEGSKKIRSGLGQLAGGVFNLAKLEVQNIQHNRN